MRLLQIRELFTKALIRYVAIAYVASDSETNREREVSEVESGAICCNA